MVEIGKEGGEGEVGGRASPLPPWGGDAHTLDFRISLVSEREEEESNMMKA